MFVSKKSLPRRTFLRAMGTTIALPFLDAMVPALSAHGPQAHSASASSTLPTASSRTSGRRRRPDRIRAGPDAVAVASLRDKITVLSGRTCRPIRRRRHGDHPRASAVADRRARLRPDAAGRRGKLATTVDQLLVREIGKTSRIPSIEMSVDFPTGFRDSGDCFYVNTVSWRNETTPNNTESHPRIVRTSVRRRRQRGSAPVAQPVGGSILDSVREEANRVANSLGRRQGQAARVSRLGARDRAAHPARGIAAGGYRAAGAADRHSVLVRCAHQADVRPPGAGLPGRHHPRVQHDRRVS